MEGSKEAKNRLRVVMEKNAGEHSIADPCEELGVSEARLHELRAEALEIPKVLVNPWET